MLALIFIGMGVYLQVDGAKPIFFNVITIFTGILLLWAAFQTAQHLQKALLYMGVGAIWFALGATYLTKSN